MGFMVYVLKLNLVQAPDMSVSGETGIPWDNAPAHSSTSITRCGRTENM